MPIKEKDPIKMIEKARKEGIPTITFKATDKAALAAIGTYNTTRYLLGVEGEGLDWGQEQFRKFLAWQEANPDKVKNPD